jgi:hypothetical protein
MMGREPCDPQDRLQEVSGSALLVTRNTKDFPADDPGVRMPY